MTIEKFDHFLTLMEENWPEAYENMAVAMPCIDKIYSINEAVRTKMMAEYGLQSSDFGLMTALRRSPPPHLLTPTEILDYMLISSGGLTKALYRLEGKGFITRKASLDDGRVKRVQLTDTGKSTIEEIIAKLQKNHQHFYSDFTQQETEQLEGLLAKLLLSLEK